MVLGAGGGGDTVAFNIKAIADLKGIDQTSKALAGLSKQGEGIGSGVNKGALQASSSLGKLRGNIGALQTDLDKVSTFGFVAGAATFAGLGIAIGQASDLAESLNKVNVIFGEQADVIESFADSAAQNLGISKQAALEATGIFGNLFKTMGLAPAAVTDMSQAVVTLASDLASFGNFDPAQVLQDLQSGLVGEAEPLRKYGILINDAALQQELMAEGVQKVNGEFTEGQKVQARYNLILQQTTSAQGDFKNTSDGLANSTRIAKAELIDAAGAIGVTFLPIVAAAAGAIGDVAHAFNALPDSVKSIAAVSIAVAGGLAFLAAVGAKVIAIGIDTAATWTRVAGAFGETAVSADAAAASMTAAGASAATANAEATALSTRLASLARLAAAGILIVVTLELAGDILDASQHGGSPGLFGKAEALGQALGGAIADGFHKVGADTVGNAIDDSLSERALNLKIQDKAIELGLTVKPKLGGDFGDALLEQLNLTVADVAREVNTTNLPVEEVLLRHADALGLQIPALEKYRQSVTSTVTATDELTASTDDAAQSAEDQAAAEKAAEDALKKHRDQIDSLIDAYEKLNDGASFALDAIAARSGSITIDVGLNVAGAEKSLENAFQVGVGNLQAISSTVSGVQSWADELINVEGVYGKIDDLKNKGLITQARYDMAQRAYNRLTADNKDIQESLLVIQSLQAPFIAKATDALDDQLNKIEGMAPAEQAAALGFLDAGESAKFLALQTQLAAAAAGDLGEDGKASLEAIVQGAVAADPYLKAMLQQMGLISVGTDGTITVNWDSVTQATDASDILFDRLDTLVTVLADIFDIDIDSSDATTATGDVEGLGTAIDDLPKDTTVTVTAKLTPLGTPVGPVPIDDETTGVTTVTTPAPVQLTADDKVTPVVDEVNTTLTTFQGDATATANATGQAIAQGLQTGFQIAAEAAAPAISTILGSLNIGNLVYNYGFNDGYNFGVGFANGITATAASVFNAAFNVGYMAHLGTQAGMDAHSPSRLAAKDGQNWVDSFVATLDNGKQSVQSAAAGLASEMRIGAQPSAAMQSMVLGDRRAQSVLATSSSPVTNHTSSTVVHFENHVHGITDPAAVSDRVVADFQRTFDRLNSAGLFGR